jgi:ketosteroid isomerase-like protein
VSSRTLAVCTIVAFSTFVAACQPTEEQAVSQNELIARSLVDAIQAADTAAIAELFWPEATYDDYSSQLQHRGVDEIVGYLTSLHEWADDVYMNVGAVHVSRTGAVAEWVFAGIQARPMGEMVPVATGLEVTTNGVTILEIDGGRIRRGADYMDTTQMLLQLGGRVELPGGAVMELDVVR